MLENALNYAGRGWKVFPLHSIINGKCSCGRSCASPGKHPRVKGGFKAATADIAQVTAWWSKWPQANIGIATGGGLTVVDLDGPEGAAELAAMVARHAPVPLTLTAQTGRGYHLYFKAEGIGSSAKGKVHIRGEGGYVVAPPSNHISGNAYKWIAQYPLVEMPDWLKQYAQSSDAPANNGQLTIGPLPNYLKGGNDLSKKAQAGLRMQWSAAEEDRLWNALCAVPSNTYDDWLKAGLALHSLEWGRSDGTDIGLDLWHEWSETTPEKYAPAVLDEKWQTFGRVNGTRLSEAWIFHRAKELGWRGDAFTAPQAAANGQAGLIFTAQATVDPLQQLNEKYAVIGDIGGKCLVLSWVNSKVDDSLKVPSFQSFKSFAERYGNQYVTIRSRAADGTIKEEAKQLGAYWLKWAGRRSYEGIDLVPNGEPLLPGGYLNLWSGFAVPPVAGSWSLMQRHIFEVLADGNRAYAEYIFKFAAWAVQNPGDRAEVALVFRGGKGSGKGTFANALKRMFGQHGLQIFNSKHLVGAFNGHLRNCLLLFADEAFWAGDKQGESVLKGLITEPALMIEQKGVDAAPWKNRLHVIMAANADWVVPASHDERRYAMFDASPARINDESYFNALHSELQQGGLSAMLHDLLKANLKGWHPRKIISNSEGLQHQKELSLAPIAAWWEDVLQSGALPFVANPDQECRAADILQHLKYAVGPSRDANSNALGRFLRSNSVEGKHTSLGNVYRFPDLAYCRRAWERKMGQWKWREPDAKWQTSHDYIGR